MEGKVRRLFEVLNRNLKAWPARRSHLGRWLTAGQRRHCASGDDFALNTQLPLYQMEPLRYQSLDPRFEALFGPAPEIRQVWMGGEWLEGPAWIAQQKCLVFSDIPNDRQWAFHPYQGTMRQLQAGNSRYTNGATVDSAGSLLLCEHGTRSLVRVTNDGVRQTIIDRFDGGRLNSPNDVTVDPNGTIWFTDPSYGIESDRHGIPGPREQAGNFVFGVSAQGEVLQVLKGFAYPNGIGVSPDGQWLYVADSGGSRSPRNERHIRRFPLRKGRAEGGGPVFAVCPNGVFDGFAIDAGGRIWASASDGVYVYDISGRPLGFIPIPECVSNLCFADPGARHIYVTASTSLYHIDLG